MNFPTLTPEIQSYCIAVIAVFSLSSTSLASKLQGPYEWNVAKPRFLLAHLALLASCSTLAAAILGVPKLFPDSLAAFAGQTCAGVALGIVAIFAELAIVRAIIPAERVWRHPRMSTLSLRILVAPFEEMVYRGYLVMLCQEIPDRILYAVALAFTVLAFALAHIYSGPVQAAAKLPLGLLTLVAVLASNALLPAIVAHVLFNLFSAEEPGRDQVVERLRSTY
jgi:Type II CAAX prenyl endopeptidase Rce1-like